MPIVFVCNAELDIVWIDNNFCATVDCGRHVALGRSLFDFLSVPAVDPFRADVAALGKGLERTTYSTTFRGRDGDELIFTFYIERVPSFEGVEGATCCASRTCLSREDTASCRSASSLPNEIGSLIEL